MDADLPAGEDGPEVGKQSSMQSNASRRSQGGKGRRESTVLLPKTELLETTKGTLTDVYKDVQGRKTVGEGSFAKVYLTWEKTDAKKETTYAVKCIPYGEMEKKGCTVENEVSITKQLDHKYLVKAISFIDDTTAQMNYIVMENYNGKSCRQRLDYVFELAEEGVNFEEYRLKEATYARTAYEMLTGIQYLHHNLIMHRDIQPCNYCLKYLGKRSPIKLCDFGSATFFTEGQVLTQGAPCAMLYCSPEMMKSSYTQATDVWSMGATFYHIMMSQVPFGALPPRSNDPTEFREMMTKGGDIEKTFEEQATNWNKNDGDWKLAQKFMVRCMTVDVAKRVTAEQALKEETWILQKKDIPADEDEHLPCCSLL